MATSNKHSVAESSKRPRTERRNRDKEVMDAAIAVISDLGYAATSVQEIANRVGVLKGSLYHYFNSKEDLLYRILTESHAQSSAIAEEVAALNLPPFEELCEFLSRISLWFLNNTERANIFFREARHLNGEYRVTIRENGRAFNRYLFELIEQGQESGTITDSESTLILTEYVLGSLNNVRDWPRRAKNQYTAAQMSASFVQLTRRTLAA